MESVDAYIYLVIGLLGVAYPILLLFEQEWESKAFPYTLYSSLFFIIIWSLKLPPLIQIDNLNSLIEKSSIILVSVNSILLVVFFLFFVRKVIIYYTLTKLIAYLIRKHEKSRK
jgi:hypothetical protein